MSLLLDPEKVYIHCRNCNTFLCKATDMRRRLQNYICIAPDLKDKTFVRKSNKPDDRRYDVQIGKILIRRLKSVNNLSLEIRSVRSEVRVGVVVNVMLFIDHRFFK